MQTLRDRLKTLGSFLRFVWLRFYFDRCLKTAGSLTFTTLLALVPLITIVFTVMAAFPTFADFSTPVKVFLLENLVPEAAGRIITVYMQQFSDNAARLTALGIAGLAVTSVMLMMTIDSEFNEIWRVSRPRPLRHQILMYWAVLTIGPLLIGASLSITSTLVTLSLGYFGGLESAGVVMLKWTSTLLTCFAFAWLYWVVPNRHVRLVHALIGGIVAGLAFEGMKRGFALYVSQFPTYQLIYGTFASFPIFLLWIYLSWLIVLAGAVIAACLPYWQDQVWRMRTGPAGEFYAALQVLKSLHDAHLTGSVLTTAQLKERIRFKLEDIEGIIARLSAAGWVRPVIGGGMTLSRAAGEIKVADVYRLFVFEPDAFETARERDSELASLSRDLASQIENKMNLPLSAFFARGKEPDARLAEIGGRSEDRGVKTTR
ncbi:MAG: YihY family inner membrane protein [Burkholderiales bacterium]